MKILPLIVFAALVPSPWSPAQEQSNAPSRSGLLPEDGRLTLREGDRPRPFRIETGEVVVTGEDGVPVVVSTPAVNNLSGLRMETMMRSRISGRKTQPTAFPEDRPRTEANRRVVADTVIVRLAEGVDPSLIAQEAGAVECSLLLYAPGRFLMRFSDAWAALAAAEALPKLDGVLDAYVELGRRLYPRMVPEDPHFSFETSGLGAYTEQTLTTDVQPKQKHADLPVAATRRIPSGNKAYQWYLRNELMAAGKPNANYVYETDVLALGDKPYLEPVPNWAPFFTHDIVRNGLLFPVDINVSGAWDLVPTLGDGVTYAIVDEGVDYGHNDLPPGSHRAGESFNYVGTPQEPGSPFGDNYHHGTGMAGIILANTNNSKRGMAGIAPKARYMSLRLLGGFATDSQVSEALIKGAQRKDGPNILDPYDDQYSGTLRFDISVNAWGYGDSGTDFAVAPVLFDRALLYGVINGRDKDGAIYIFAGDESGDSKGNNNSSDVTNSLYSIHVGAVTDIGRRVAYSSPGASLHVVAPSNGDELAPQILLPNGDLYPSPEQALELQTVDNEHWPLTKRRRTQRIVTLENDNEYTKDFGGTSASAAMVAGVVGLMLDARPDLGWRDVQEILMRSADIVNPFYGGWEMTALGVPMSHYYGAGVVNAEKAVRMAMAWTNLPKRNLPPMTIQQLDNGGKRGIRIGTLVSSPAEEPRDPLGSSLSLLIPDNASQSLSRPVGAPPAGFRIEHVEVEVDIDHSRRGDLEITLEAPPVGSQEQVLVDRLYVPHRLDALDTMRWRFMSLRHWGARYSSDESWTLRIRDTTKESTGFPEPNNAEAGRLRGYAVTFYGIEEQTKNEVPVINNPPLLYALAGQPFQGLVQATTAANAPLIDYSFMVRSPVSPTTSRDTGISMTEPLDPLVPYISEKPEFSGVPSAGKWIVDIAASNVFGIGRKAVTLTTFGKYKYEDWQKVFFTQSEMGDIGNRRDDPDGDGHPNLIEFLTGGNPRVADPFDVPFTKEYDGVVHVVLPVDTNAEDATIRLQTSIDLETWEDVTLTQVEDPEGPLVYRGIPLDEDDARRFYRARGAN